jgi:ribosomal protein S9
MATANSYFYALGRRKSSTARVRLTSKKGDFVINEKPVNDYFDGSKHLQHDLLRAFTVLELDAKRTSIFVPLPPKMSKLNKT